MKEILLADFDEIPERGRKIFSVEGVQVGIFRIDDQIYAWRNTCPHQGGPVCQGKLMRAVEERLDDQHRSLGVHFIEGSLNIICPWHGYEFDVRTGRYAGAADLHLIPQPHQVREGKIYVSIDD
ncbi:Rieske (2Fe-2S) protein [Allopusillimonas soli]|uniref:Rieske (2Fe-2S) protein n=1 Tax=Allopusillimonas soli TaxID=659016 RepID=A0A853F8J1_9BURK|nr:Rieske (2Fe-2S) protein [Allopusillimonas soli]NYT36269.1 Rieske (2Fe-2S) protein [Allopusillimonas soli]TEA76593.1 Rieske (2Fe-2S) protein [Allopusillimonas soli]